MQFLEVELRLARARRRRLRGFASFAFPAPDVESNENGADAIGMFVVAGTSNGSTPPFSSARCFAATAAAIAAAFLASSCGYVTSGGSLKFARSFGGDVHCFGSGYGGSAGTSRGGL